MIPLLVGLTFGWFLRGVDWSSLPTHWAYEEPESRHTIAFDGREVERVAQAAARRQRGDG